MPQQCVRAVEPGTGANSPSRALVCAVPQGKYQLLLAQSSLSIAASCSGMWPRGLGQQPSVKTSALCLLQQKQLGYRE